MGKPAYINFTENCLIHKYPLVFNKDTIVIELVGHTKPSQRLLKIIKYFYYHELFFSFALSLVIFLTLVIG